MGLRQTSCKFPCTTTSVKSKLEFQVPTRNEKNPYLSLNFMNRFELDKFFPKADIFYVQGFSFSNIFNQL